MKNIDKYKLLLFLWLFLAVTEVIIGIIGVATKVAVIPIANFAIALCLIGLSVYVYKKNKKKK